MQALLPSCHKHLLQTKQQPGYRSAQPAARRQHLRLARAAAAPCASMATNLPAAAAEQPLSWSPHAAVSHYLAAGRNWRAVEAFYISLVAGRASLADIGLAPAGAAPAAPNNRQSSCQQQQQQQQQQEQGWHSSVQARPADEPHNADDAQQQQQQLQRRTFKVHVSYLGSSFAGWMRQPGRQTVDGTLAAALAAAGLADTPPGFKDSSGRAKRKAARAERRANKRAGAAAGAGPGVTGSAELARQGQQQLVIKSSGDAAAGAGAEHHEGGTPLGEAAATGAAAAAAAAEGVQQLPSINCGGRTDAGVTAVGQVISFYTWQQHLGPAQLQEAVNQQLQAAIPTKQPIRSSSSSSSSTEVLAPSCQARVWHVAADDREFHATFSAHWRRYVYLLPLRQQQQHASDALLPKFTDELTAALQQPAQQAAAREPQAQQQDCHHQQQLSAALQAADADPAKVNALLQQLQGKQINYYAYARDTPRGKDCECTLHVARASLVHLPAAAAAGQEHLVQQDPEAAACAADKDVQQQGHQQQQQGVACLCIELAGDRFLRRMVRVLVATAIREALLLQQGQAGAGSDTGTCDHSSAAAVPGLAAAAAAAAGGGASGQAGGSPGLQALVALADSMDRQATAPPAPALGLCFAAVGY